MTAIPKGAARAVADLSRGMILASVEIEAPPERVFKAISTSELAEWWGSPELYRVTKHTADLRVGGAWRSEGVGSDGKPFSVTGEFLEVEPPRILAFTWNYDWDPTGSTTTIRYQLDPIPGGTRITLRHEGFGDNVAACGGHAQGWERVLTWLQNHCH